MVNERTGTIVMGGDVKLSPVSVIHGNLSIQVVTTYVARWRNASGWTRAAWRGRSGARWTRRRQEGKGGPETLQPIVVPETNLTANDGAAQSMRLDEGANVDELVNGLHAIGTTARDVVAILQAIRAEGGMQAELEVQ